MSMPARTLAAVTPLRSKSDNASLSSMGFGPSMTVWEGVSRIGGCEF